MKKRVISFLLAAVLLFGTFAVSASALDEFYTDSLGGSFGDFYASDGNGKRVSAQYLFGAHGYLYFEAVSKGYDNVAYCCEIYADKAMTKDIGAVVSAGLPAGNTSSATAVDTSIFPKSGTYYACAYVLVYDGEDFCVDTDTYREFTVNVSKTSTDLVKQTPVLVFTDTVSGPRISWYAIPGAKNYCVYRKLKDGDSWTRIATLSSDVRTYTDKAANKTGQYIYTVKAVNASGKASKYTGIRHYFVAATQKIAVGTTADNAVNVQWAKVAGVSGYIVYRKTGSGSWQRLATVKGADNVIYTDKTAKTGNTVYTYTVKSYKGVGGEILYSSFLSGTSVRFIAAPAVNAPTAITGGIKVSWNKAAGATSYIIYRSPLITSTGAVKWAKLAAVPASATSYTDKSASADGKYTYTVRSVYGSVNGSYSNKGASYIKAPVLVSAAETYNNGIALKWKKSAGATGYYIYRKTADTSWVRIASTGNRDTFIDYSDKVSGENYIYTVRAFAYSSAIASGYNKTGLTVKHIEAPVITSADPCGDNVCITWNPVSGAAAYTVYRKNIASDSWASVAKVSGSASSYVDMSASAYNGYIYTVRSEGASSRGSYSNEGVQYYSVPDMRSVFNEYKAAAHSVALNGNCSYNKKEWQTIEKIECGSVGGILQPIIDGYMTTEDEAEVQTVTKGYQSRENFPDCTLTDMSKVVSAEKKGNVITIVMADEEMPKNASTSFLGKVSNSMVYWDDVETELEGISVIKSYDDTQYTYKGYKITAEIVNGKFVSLKHEGVIIVDCPEAKITLFSLPLSATFKTYSVYYNFVY